ncbi:MULTISPECIES: right-handed parallel beta-helix repeat-containing protein [unclassified Rhizobium]|uniref:right-handed parallel beta-helix repeat-containing protein n=1 Tax=unclassified Rhizobium TaxID=2613769 RepID=UPI000EAA842A|nr:MULTISPECIES: right-handed parallel beta-helix repeat-containing protein [unclassified Rhizobium]AYG65782.1 hypothetical protein CCGE531_07055 [Rhizobium sp. CCGE531]AYG72263.1 hypothetical protein CCGE532_07055 [Rhizobium sp. CCGE532]
MKVDGAAARWNITGNTIYAADTDNAGGGDGILVNAGTDIVIDANLIHGNSTAENGVRLVAGVCIIVNNNRIRGCTNGIAVQSGTDYYTVVGNLTVNNSGSGVVDAGGQQRPARCSPHCP